MVYRWWGGGGEERLYSGGSSIDGDSILISQKPKAVEGGERHAWKLWEADGSSDRRCILSIICNITRSCYMDESEFEKTIRRSYSSRRCVLFRDRSRAEGVE